MRSPYTCARSGRSIQPGDCWATICSTTRGADLTTCRGCTHGRELMATTAYGRRALEAEQSPDGTSRSAPLWLRRTLGYIIPRYPRKQSQGVRFLLMFARKFGFVGTPADYERELDLAGLRQGIVRRIKCVMIDEKAREIGGVSTSTTKARASNM